MTRNCFLSIMHYVQFDGKTTRATRRQADKFCLVRETGDKFILNCHLAYHPTAMLTVDGQLFTTKSRCPFTQYMPNNPGNFRISSGCWLMLRSFM